MGSNINITRSIIAYVFKYTLFWHEMIQCKVHQHQSSLFLINSIRIVCTNAIIIFSPFFSELNIKTLTEKYFLLIFNVMKCTFKVIFMMLLEISLFLIIVWSVGYLQDVNVHGSDNSLSFVALSNTIFFLSFPLSVLPFIYTKLLGKLIAVSLSPFGF